MNYKRKSTSTADAHVRPLCLHAVSMLRRFMTYTFGCQHIKTSKRYLPATDVSTIGLLLDVIPTTHVSVKVTSVEAGALGGMFVHLL